MKIIFLAFFLITGVAFASTVEEVESFFQKGMQLSQQGLINEALDEFHKVVSSDPSNLPQDYYIQTYSEACFNIGLLYSKKDEYEKGIENFKKALEINPEHKRALYYIAFNLISLGEIAEAKSYYERVKLLGIVEADDIVGKYFGSTKDRELSIQYQSFFAPDKTISVTIKGNPCGDDGLIRDTLSGIEKFSKIINFSISPNIYVERVRSKNGDKIVIEKWRVGEKESQKEIWVKYNFAPPEGFPSKVMIQFSETEIFS